MMCSMKRILAASALFLAGSMAHAAEFKGVVGVGLDFGGDTLISGSYSDGSTWSVKANEGFALYGGAVMVTGDFETQATIGYKFGGPQAKNGSVTLSTVPIELMEFYRTQYVRAGVGLVYQRGTKLDVNVPGFLGNGTYNFDNALGNVVQVGWAPQGKRYSVDLRYTSIKYKQSNTPNPKNISGNSVGVSTSFYF